MNPRRCKGFLMTYVIVAMATLSVVMAVLTSGAKIMLIRANEAYLRGVERNLTASGLAWAEAKLADRANANLEGPVKLDPDNFGAPQASVAVQILAVHENTATVRINTSCTKGRRTLNTSRDYAVELPQ